MRLPAWLTGRPPLTPEQRTARAAAVAEQDRRDEQQRDVERRRKEQERQHAQAVRARQEREAEEMRLAAALRAERDAAFARAAEQQGYYWPGESMPESRLSGRSRLGRVVEALFGGWQ